MKRAHGAGIPKPKPKLKPIPMEHLTAGPMDWTDELLRHGPTNWAWLAALAATKEMLTRNSVLDLGS